MPRDDVIDLLAMRGSPDMSSSWDAIDILELSTNNWQDRRPEAATMWRQTLCALLLGAITLAVQASEDPTESLAGVHDLSKYSNVPVALDNRDADHSA